MGLTINPLSLKIIIPITNKPNLLRYYRNYQSSLQVTRSVAGLFFEASYYKSDPTKGPLEFYDMPPFGANSELSMP